ncbi:chemotaxis protein CheW [Salinisphaera sp. SPP-AMP-43]|uniref:chemotaxis protein CheW n=1 Tax=Salinisphaera sp. SPP-AMP-43 TaxID=3121288 RepID=UPI003C6E4BE5
MSQMRLAVFALGATEIALEASVVREAVAGHEELISPAPQSPAWSVGSIWVRGVPIPVIDLSEWLGLPVSERGSPAYQVVIVRFDGRLVGFIVDRVCGVLPIDAADLYPVHDARAHSVTRWMVSPEPERAIYVLDLAAILSLEGNIQIESAAPSEAAEPLPDEAGFEKGEDRPSQRLVVVRASGCWLGLPLAAVREICAARDIESPVIVESSYLGHIAWRGQRLPLLDIGSLIGRDPAGTAGEHYLVIETMTGLFATAVERVIGLIDYETGQKPNEIRLKQTESAIIGALEDEDGSQILRLDPERLAAHGTVVGLAVAGIQAGTHRTADRSWQRFAFIDFEAGASYTVPIDTLIAVQRYPDQVTAAARHAPFLGYCVQDGRHVALVDLRRLLGQQSVQTKPSDQLLIVACEEHFVGFVIDGVREMRYVEAPADSYVERWRGDRASNAEPIDECKQLIALGEDEEIRFLSLLRLPLLAKRLLETAGLVGASAQVAAPQST